MSDSPLSDIRIGFVSSRWAEGSRIPCHFERSTASTNELAKAEAFDAAAEETLKIYFTDHQTAGRGRGSNNWITAAPGSALLATWSFALQDPPQPTLTPRVGLALARALAATWPFVPWSLKAPNDIFIEDGKIAGLLIEVVSQGPDVRLLVGLGLNVLDAPTAVPNATALATELPSEAPLLGEDWITFLERWTFELSGAVGRADEELNSTERASLRELMNRRSDQQPPVDEVLADGGFIAGGKTRSWMEI